MGLPYRYGAYAPDFFIFFFIFFNSSNPAYGVQAVPWSKAWENSRFKSRVPESRIDLGTGRDVLGLPGLRDETSRDSLKKVPGHLRTFVLSRDRICNVR